LTQAFKFYDLDKDGYLRRDEVFSLLEGCDNEEIDYLMNEIDTNQDRKVSL
jgi:Ca2+-binding EF-hand superfamily protein